MKNWIKKIKGPSLEDVTEKVAIAEILVHKKGPISFILP